ncbi:hypothetical protein WJX81_001044 [Elliptochloris bilobata]|uniref:EF-hand domain-containing protein n=1 Tax=Elliptochloris bilobata TaxID=381761 RepID=A0AAW1SHS5_9CHLO
MRQLRQLPPNELPPQPQPPGAATGSAPAPRASSAGSGKAPDGSASEKHVESEDPGGASGSAEDEDEDDSDAESDLELGDLDEDDLVQRRLAQRPVFWLRLFGLAVTAGLLAAGLSLYFLRSGLLLKNIPLFRWLCFAAMIVPACYAAVLVVKAMLWVLEDKYFLTSNVVFHIIAVRREVRNVLAATLVMIIFSVFFWRYGHHETQVNPEYWVVVKFLGCLMLFTVANLLACLFANLLQGRFNKATQAKLTEALRKEYYLNVLAAPPKQELSKLTHMLDSGAVRALKNMKKVSLHTPRSPFRFSRRRRVSGGGGAEAPSAPQSSGAPAVSACATNSTEASAPYAGEDGEGMEEALLPHPRESSHLRLAPREHSRLQPPAELPPSDGAPREHEEVPRRQSVAEALLAEQLRSGKPMSLERADKATLAAKLSAVERHLRNNAIAAGTTLTGRGRLTRVASAREPKAALGAPHSKRLAFFLFHNVLRDRDRNYILEEDVHAFMRPKQAREAFHFLDRDKSGRLTLREVNEAVATVFQERANLRVQLQDTRATVGTLRCIMAVLLQAVNCFFWLAIFDVDLRSTWTVVSSVILAFAFAFQNSVRHLFESVIFLFFTHPFDVGDVIVLSRTPGSDQTKYRVETLGLNCIVLLANDNSRMWIPVWKLAEANLVNLSRSEKHIDFVKVSVNINIPAAVLGSVEAALKPVFEDISHNKELGSWFSVRLVGTTDPLKLELGIAWECNHKGWDMGAINAGRTLVLRAVGAELSRAGVSFTNDFVGGAPQLAPLLD